MILGGIIGAVLFVWVMMFLLRVFSNSVTTVIVEEVRPGVECAKMVTADGAAIDCWYTPREQ
tara:strand:+ start:114 stop:299 length:186 start_codon:yes stop_codon:yes gene_type:complete